ncbi:MAG: C25 family cysteine peptidase, partial [Candidatus Zixiibacteriota bacterium]
MKRLVMGFWLAVMLSIGFAGMAMADQSVVLSDSPSGVKLVEQDMSGLTLQLEIGKLDFYSVATPDGNFTMAKIPGLGRSFNIGEPNLPIASKVLSIPFGCDLKANLIDYDIEEISLAGLGITDPLIPAQPSVSKSDDPLSIPFEYDRDVYATSGFYSLPMAETSIEGVMRGVRVARISISPVEYSPTENKIRVYKNMTIRVSFENPDWAETESVWTKYYSPFFEPVYDQLLNYEGFVSTAKSDSFNLVKYPVKYLIISDRKFETQLQPFIEWKTKKGFTVITAYTDVIGATTTAIKGYISSMYNAGTPEDPAPSFVLFVGDVGEIPAWSGSAGSHITDLKYCELTGDNLPEIYYGRFSAQNTTQLQPQIDKTMEYEKYEMPDPSYLQEVTLVSGVDATYAATFGNGQINYGTNYYFNLDHGIAPNVWLYPASDGSGAPAAIIQTVSDGVGLYNYTAHCSHTGHADPSFTTSDIPGLQNYHKYLLGIGNCCLSNTFSESTPCFGEAFLQVAGKGGIGYIGGTNSTYWYEDYYWGVGYGPVVGSGPTYEQTTQGAYDGVFHDHGEAEKYHYVTNGAIIFAGNLAVTASGSTRIQYYWEIYTLMGDPSVMTYLGVPAENNITHDATVLLTATSFAVQADPGSYVGISVDGVLHGVGYVDSTGMVDVELTPFASPALADIVITAQNREPYISTIQIIAPEGPFVIYDEHAVNDALGNNDGFVDCGESITLDMQLQNV